MTRNVHSLGDGNWFSFVVGDPEYHPTNDDRFKNWNGEGDNLVGIIETHRTPSGDYCSGMVTFVPGRDHPERPVWRVNNLDPMDLEPSIQCTLCENHGHIRGGIWVAA